MAPLAKNMDPSFSYFIPTSMHLIAIRDTIGEDPANKYTEMLILM